MKCWKCKKDFEYDEVGIKGLKRIAKCIHCNTKYDISDKSIIHPSLNYSKDGTYIKMPKGQIKRVEKKIKMSKKERLKMRRFSEKLKEKALI